MGIIILTLLAAVEIFFMVWNIAAKNLHRKEKSIAVIAEAAIFIVLSLTGVIMWSFRYYTTAILLAVCAIVGTVVLLGKKDKPYKAVTTVLKTIGKLLLIGIALFPAILFPQYRQLETSGSYGVASKSYVFTDESRNESFSDEDINRNVTVEVYYPENADGTIAAGEYPLVVFSHGAFGFYESNYSTYAELVSNGYIVASINHPYHAFFDTEAYGTLVTVDPNVISKALYFNGKEMTQEEFDLSHEWLQLRVDDMNFVVDTLKSEAEGDDEILSMINPEKIGLMGHSLGGAASAELGRERDDITAVIVVDGTIIGDELEYGDGYVVNDQTPYPLPLLDIFGENHYNESKQYADFYPNHCVSKNSDMVYDVVMKGAKHLDVTDLTMFSPILADTLGSGDVDKKECLNNMNGLVREFWDWQLKGEEEPQIKSEY